MIVKNTHPFPNERLFDVDPLTGTRTYMSSGGKYGTEWAFRTEFIDAGPEVDAARELEKDGDHWKKGVKESWLHAAHVPDGILLQWHLDGVDINDPKELLRMVQKREWRYLCCTNKILV